MYVFSNVAGVFVFDDKIDLVDEMLFNTIGEYNDKEKLSEKIKHKHKDLKEPDEKTLSKILAHFKDKKYADQFRSRNLQITKLDVKNSVNEDVLIIQAIKSIEELDRSINLLAKRLREWYGLHNPEFSRATEDHEEFVKDILENSKEELLKRLNLDSDGSMGADMGQESLEPIRSLAHQVYDLHQLRKSNFEYISSLMDSYCPNIKAVCDTMVAAKLIEHAGSLKRLSLLPASTVQILGAEKALFRHMRTGAKSPKHGIIASHLLMASVPLKLHGKLARNIADKISIAAKVDYFRGKFVGDRLKKELEEKFKQE